MIQSSAQQNSEGEQGSEQQDVAGRFTQTDVQRVAVVDAHHLAPCGDMCGEVGKGKQGGPRAACEEQRETQRDGRGSQGEITPAADACAEADDDRAFVREPEQPLRR